MNSILIRIGQCIALMAATVLWRLAPFRPPNVEPILAALMPFGKTKGPAWAFAFGAGSILAYDVLTGTLSSLTPFTSVSYGLLGLAAPFVLRGKLKGLSGSLLFAVIGTIFYDLMTGVIAGMVIWGMPFGESVTGQLPFTINHLIGNVILALALSPLVEWGLEAWDRQGAEKTAGERPALQSNL